MNVLERRLSRFVQLAGWSFAATFAWWAVRARFVVPYRDDWDWLIDLLQSPESLRLFAPHNEHVIPLPRLLLALQYRLAGLDTWVLTSAALVAQGATAALLLGGIAGRWPSAPGMRAAAGGVALIALTFAWQLQGVVFAASILFPLVVAFSAAAFVLAAGAGRVHGARRRWRLAGAALAAAGAMGTTTVGLVVPAIVAAVVWCRRLGPVPVFAFAIQAGAGVAAYVALAGWPDIAGGGAAAPAATTVAYFLAFLGSFATQAWVPAGIAAGAFLVVLCARVARRLSRDREVAPAIEHVGLGLALLAVAAAGLTAAARADFGVAQAAQSRYAVIALAGWAGLAAALASQADRAGVRAGVRRAALAGVAAAVVALAPLHLFAALVWEAKADHVAAAGLLVGAGVRDDRWAGALHPRPLKVYLVMDWTGAGRAVPGARGPDASAAPRCEGLGDLVAVQPGPGYRLRGVFYEPGTGVIVDGTGARVGAARRTPLVAQPDAPHGVFVGRVRDRLLGRVRPDPTWLGFAGVGAGPPYTLVILDARGGGRCRATVPAREAAGG